MSWTKDEERLLQWAANHKEDLRNSEELESYWKEKGNNSGIEEYGFETFNEVFYYLEQNIRDKDAAKILSIASMKAKERPYKSDDGETRIGHKNLQSESGEISDFVYVF